MAEFSRALSCSRVEVPTFFVDTYFGWKSYCDKKANTLKRGPSFVEGQFYGCMV
jgi:hypothetical protein